MAQEVAHRTSRTSVTPARSTTPTPRVVAGGLLEKRGLAMRPNGDAVTGPFEVFPDFSRQNATKHNAERSDTFRTPSKRASDAARAKIGMSVGPWNPSAALSTKDLLDVCELSFSKNLRDLQHTMLAELRAELQGALGPLKEELSGTVADARGAVALEEILHRLGGLEIPAVDLAPVLVEVSRRAEAQDAAAERLEARLREELGDLRRAVEEGRRRQEAAEGGRADRIASLEDAVSQVQSRSRHVQESLEALRASNAEAAERFCLLQAATRSQAESFETSLEQHLTRFLRDVPGKVDLERPMLAIGALQTSVASDTRMLLREIATIQRALNVDFLAVLNSRLGEVTRGIELHMDHMSSKASFSRGEVRRRTGSSAPTSSAPASPAPAFSAPAFSAPASSAPALLAPVLCEKRVREYWAQTERQSCSEIACQTDMPEKPLDRKKTRRAESKRTKLAKESSRHMKRAVFADAETMRQKARAALIRPQYNVTNYYSTEGLFQAIARHPNFETLTLVIILLNAMWIGVDTEFNHASLVIDASPPFQVAENAFCAYFAAELFTRFMAFASKLNCLRDRWFVFDSVLVLLMVVEVWVLTFVVAASGSAVGLDFNKSAILRAVRIVKLLRVGRIARLLRAVPELLIMAKGMKAASRSVAIFLAMWLIIIYIFALVFVQIAEREGAYFSSVPHAMNSLLLDGIFPDHSVFMKTVSGESWVFWPLTLAFVCLAVLTMMNMLVGVLVEIVGAIAATERESALVIWLASGLREMWSTFGLNLEVGITQEEFERLLVEPEAARIISLAGADVVMLADISSAIFDDLCRNGSEHLRFEALVELVLSMRGMGPAKVKDVREQTRLTREMLREVSKNMLNELREDLGAIRDICEAKSESEEEGSNNSQSSLPPSARSR